MKHISRSSRGFTLLEVLMVVAAIGILAGITVVAINPGRQLAKARNQTRTADVNTIRNALKEYSLDNQGQVPSGITGTLKKICQSDASSCNTNSNRVNLSVIEQYLANEALPEDPDKSDGDTLTGYEVAVSTQGNYKVKAPKAENGESIAVGPDNLTLLLLDDYPGAAAAYSVRLLGVGYDGPALTVRRDSDNETSDIGFKNDELDTTQLENFCGTSDCYVQTWHDQSGNDRDATQSTNDNQPKIYDGGTESVVTVNNEPAIKGDGSDDKLTNTNIDVSTSSNTGSAFSVYQIIGSTSASFSFNNVYRIRESGTNDNSMDFHWDDEQGDAPGFFIRKGGNQNVPNYTTKPSFGVQYLDSLTDDGSNYVYRQNNTQLDSGSVSGTYSANFSEITLFESTPTTNNNHLQGYIQELIVYNSDQSSNRSGIEGNINDYFSIY